MSFSSRLPRLSFSDIEERLHKRPAGSPPGSRTPRLTIARVLWSISAIDPRFFGAVSFVVRPQLISEAEDPLRCSTTFLKLSAASARARVVAAHFGAFAPIGLHNSNWLSIPGRDRDRPWLRLVRIKTGPPLHSRHRVRQQLVSFISFEFGQNSVLPLAKVRGRSSCEQTRSQSSPSAKARSTSSRIVSG